MVRKGFTLLEIIIVIGIFSIVSIISVDAYLNGFRNDQKTNIQNKILQDSNYIFSQIIADISSSKIDFEEYYNQCVIQGACPNKDILSQAQMDQIQYGNNHGYYSWQFYTGGFQDAAETIADAYGAICENSLGEKFNFPNEECTSGALSFSEDSNTGINPATNNLLDTEINLIKDRASAFHSTVKINGFNRIFGAGKSEFDSQENTLGNLVFSELYLENPMNQSKIIYGKKQIDNSNAAVAKIELNQVDFEDDSFSYPVFAYECAAKYNCQETSTALSTLEDFEINSYRSVNRSDLYFAREDGLFENFVPISPLTVNVKSLKFHITSLEDPEKAYREDQIKHPLVTVFIELEPSTRFKLPFFSENFNLKLQTTVATSM